MQIEVEDVANLEGVEPEDPTADTFQSMESSTAGDPSSIDKIDPAVDTRPEDPKDEVRDRFVLECSFDDEGAVPEQDAPTPPPILRRAQNMVSCPDCGRRMQARTLKYSHSRTCPGRQKTAVAAPQSLAEAQRPDPLPTTPEEPSPATPQPYRPPAPPPPCGAPPHPPLRGGATEGREVQAPPPFPDVRLTPQLRSRAMLRRDYEVRAQRYVGLFAGALPG